MVTTSCDAPAHARSHCDCFGAPVATRTRAPHGADNMPTSVPRRGMAECSGDAAAPSKCLRRGCPNHATLGAPIPKYQASGSFLHLQKQADNRMKDNRLGVVQHSATPLQDNMWHVGGSMFMHTMKSPPHSYIKCLQKLIMLAKVLYAGATGTGCFIGSTGAS